ncbi:hypothetical protein MNBD_NITROSPINAE01-449 [hydrothermal vent metagenome]|uniref:Uncharacterized protein n=1 Tax=hydrothermal vent metagenome TaxID=652676 RepID=A0A3B1BT53_9ZZZZ
MNTENKKTAPPLGILVLLSFVLPGAGQLANDDKVKGYLFIAISMALLLMFFAKLTDIFPQVHEDLLAGVIPTITEEFMDKLESLGQILLAGLFLFIVATLDAVIVGKRRL